MGNSAPRPTNYGSKNGIKKTAKTKHGDEIFVDFDTSSCFADFFFSKFFFFYSLYFLMSNFQSQTSVFLGQHQQNLDRINANFLLQGRVEHGKSRTSTYVESNNPDAEGYWVDKEVLPTGPPSANNLIELMSLEHKVNTPNSERIPELRKK